MLRARLIVIAVVMAAFGLTYTLRPGPKRVIRSEAWMEDATPFAVDGYHAQPGPHGEKQTYRMSEDSYRIIQAFGIITRVFDNGVHNIDVCVIASNSPDSLHDPIVCFPGQGWKILENTIAPTHTQTRGDIPFTVLKAQFPGSLPVSAVYCYKGPASMLSTQVDVWKQWKLINFLRGDASEGSFYRFIGDSGMAREQLIAFAADYMDEVNRTSKGIL
jgi:hypothetical protein